MEKRSKKFIKIFKMTIILLKLQIAALMLSLAFSGGGISKEQAISQANQTIQEATEYITTITNPVINKPIQTQPEPVSTGAPLIQDIVSQPTPLIVPKSVKSCSLSAYITQADEDRTRTEGYPVTIEWTSQNVSNLNGDLYVNFSNPVRYTPASHEVHSENGTLKNIITGSQYELVFADGTTCETKLEKDIRP